MTTPRFAERIEQDFDETSFSPQEQKQALRIVEEALEDPASAPLPNTEEQEVLVVMNLMTETLKFGEQESEQETVDQALAYVERLPEGARVAFSRIMLNGFGGVPDRKMEQMFTSENYQVIHETLQEHFNQADHGERQEEHLRQTYLEPLNAIREAREQQQEEQLRDEVSHVLEEGIRESRGSSWDRELQDRTVEEVVEVVRRERRIQSRRRDNGLLQDLVDLRRTLQPEAREQGRTR